MKKLFVFLIGMLLLYTGVRAQEADPFNYYANYIPVNIQGTVDTVYQTQLCFLQESLSDPAQIHRINVKIGSYPGGYDVFNYTFDLTQGSTPNGLGINTEDGNLVLILGEFLAGEYFYSVSIETFSGDIIGPVIRN